jgi:hypothetical protein
MKVRGLWVLLSVAAVFVSGCIPGESQSGVRQHIQVQVAFVSRSNAPLVGEPVWIVETVGMRSIPTESLRTDERGEVSVAGDYCFPIIVAADGGSVDIPPAERRERYVVQVDESGTPSVARLFGQPPADASGFKNSAVYRNCSD